jgi:type VI secretion system secreted protein VgrG
MQGGQDTVTLEGSVRGAVPGRVFTLEKHPVKSQNREFLITRVQYRVRNNDYESRGDSNKDEAGFYGKVSGMPSDRQYRCPLESVRMPRARGSDTAVVVGPPGSEIHTDKYGRIKVHFHWDRYGKKDGSDSCWIRVSYPWAGSNFGGISIPRVGQEVIIDYEHGDPQRPLVIGCVYNAQQLPPWELPANKTQSGIMSRTSPGGGVDNTNAIRFEDAKGKEEMWVRAERDRRLEVKRDETTWIGHDRMQKVVGEHVEEVGKNILVTSGASITLKATTKIVFQVGASKITMNADGTIRIEGPTRVDIN